jgi:hypothetical protein
MIIKIKINEVIATMVGMFWIQRNVI